MKTRHYSSRACIWLLACSFILALIGSPKSSTSASATPLITISKASIQPELGAKGPLLVQFANVSSKANSNATASVTVSVIATANLTNVSVSLTGIGTAVVRSATQVNIGTLSAGQQATFTINFSGVGTGSGRIQAVAQASAGNAPPVAYQRFLYIASDSSQFVYNANGELQARLDLLNATQAIRVQPAAAFNQAVEQALGSGAKTDSGVSIINAASDLTIHGTILWTDSVGNTHPARAVTVEIRDSEASGNVLVATTTTDLNGNYSAVVDNNDGTGEAGRDIFIRALATNPAVYMRLPSTTTPLFISSSVFPDVADGTDLPISLTANNTADNNTAFSALDGYYTIYQYLLLVNGSALPQLPVNFPGDGSYFSPAANAITLLQLDRFDWDVIHHEYGHYVQSQLNLDDSPGGSHSLDENLSETRGKSAGVRLAWGEGWPTYFGTSAQLLLNTATLNIPHVGDDHYTDTEDASIDYSLESNVGGNSLGEDNELSVQRIFFDLFDATADAGDTKGIALGAPALWTAVTTSHPVNFNVAYQAIIAGKTQQTISDIGCILGEHKVASQLTAPADGVATSSTAPTFTWVANGGGVSFRNNSFVVQFWNANFTTLIFSSPPLTTTSYTPSAADWTTIRSGGGAVFNWRVSSGQTASPVTGPYVSCSRSLTQAGIATATSTTTPSATPSRTPTNTAIVPSATPSRTPTNTSVPPSATPSRTPTNTAIVPSATPSRTPTNTSVPPSATPSVTPSNTSVAVTSTPSVTPSNTAFAPSGFYRAYNLAGPSLVIDGHTWLAGNASTLNIEQATKFCNQSVPLIPATDANRADMIRCSVAGTQPNIEILDVPSGFYDVYFYIWEDNKPQTFSISLQGGQIFVPNVNSGAAGSWQRMGPYRIEVLADWVSIDSFGGYANFSGIELYRR